MIDKDCAEHTPWGAGECRLQDRREDSIGIVKGILIGIGMGLALWALIIMAFVL